MMVGSGPHQVESLGSQNGDPFVNLKRKGDHEGSVHTIHNERSQPRGGSHISHAKSNKGMQLEIDQLKRKLRHARWRRTPSNSDVSSDDEKDVSYKWKSQTPPSESFFYKEEHYCEQRVRSSPRKGVGNKAMSRASNQIFKLPFTCKIEGAKLPQRFN